MKYAGISSNCCIHLPIAESLDILAGLTDFVEILSSGRHSLFDFEEVAASYHMRYAIHSPVSDGNIAEPYEKIRAASVDVIRKTADIADRVNAELLVIHPGFCLDSALFSASEAALLKSIEELGKFQDEYSVRFVMENMGSLACLHFKTPDLLPVIRSAGLGFCLDVGHAYLNGALDAFLKEHPNHLHIHDNNGIEDLHGACGEGNIRFTKDLLSSAKTGVVECMTLDDTKASLDYLSRIFE